MEKSARKKRMITGKDIILLIVGAVVGLGLAHVASYLNRDNEPLVIDRDTIEVEILIPMLSPDNPTSQSAIYCPENSKSTYYGYNSTIKVSLARDKGQISNAYLFYSQKETDITITSENFNEIVFEQTASPFNDGYSFAFDLNYTDLSDRILKDFYILMKDKYGNVDVYVLLLDLESKFIINGTPTDLDEGEEPVMNGWFMGDTDSILGKDTITLDNGKEVNIDSNNLLKMAGELKGYYSNL